MTDSSLVILNDGVLPNKTDQETEEIDKNIRIIITKLKGNYMNEGEIKCRVEISPLTQPTNWCRVVEVVYRI